MTDGEDVTDREDVDGIGFIGVDTSAFPHGRPDFTGLAQLARLAAAVGIAVVVPEPVVWELGRHLEERVTPVAEATAAAKKALAGLGQPGSAKYGFPTVDWLSDFDGEATVGEALAGLQNVEVLTPDAENYRRAVSDQAAQRGAAQPKGDVQTGATDAAILYTLEEEAARRATPYVFVAADKHFAKGFAELGVERPRTFKSIWAATRALFADSASPIDFITSIVGALPEVSALLETLTIELNAHHPYSELGEPQVVAIHVDVVAPGEPYGVSDVALTSTGDLLLTVLVSARLGVEVWGVDHDGDVVVTDTDVWDGYGRVHLLLQRSESEPHDLSIDPMGGYKLFRVDNLGEDELWWDDIEAWQETLFFLRVIPGIDAQAIEGFAEQGDPSIPRQSAGIFSIEADGSWGDGWTIRLSLDDGESVGVTCEYDATQRMWDKEAPDVPEYRLVSDTGEPTSLNEMGVRLLRILAEPEAEAS